jgi:hypothetical protein
LTVGSGNRLISGEYFNGGTDLGYNRMNFRWGNVGTFQISPGSLVPGVPPEVDAIILRLLAKEPADRAVSMGQVVRELAELMGEPMPARLASEPGIRAIPTPVPGSLPTSPVNLTPVTAPAAAFGPIATATTLGGAAAQTEPLPPRATRKGPFMLVTVGVALIGFVVVMTVTKGDKSSAQPAAAPTEPVAAPLPTPAVTPPAPMPVVTPPAPGATAAVTPPAPSAVVDQPAPATPDAGTATTPVSAAATTPVPPKPRPKPPNPRPKPTGSGTAPPPPPPGDDNGFGGRI